MKKILYYVVMIAFLAMLLSPIWGIVRVVLICPLEPSPQLPTSAPLWLEIGIRLVMIAIILSAGAVILHFLRKWK